MPNSIGVSPYHSDWIVAPFATGRKSRPASAQGDRVNAANAGMSLLRLKEAFCFKQQEKRPAGEPA
jgi:hypothetical protein